MHNAGGETILRHITLEATEGLDGFILSGRLLDVVARPLESLVPMGL